MNRPKEAFTTRQSAAADIGQGDCYVRSDYEVLYQRSNTREVSNGVQRQDDPSPGMQRPVNEKTERLSGVGTHLAKIE